MKVLMVGTPFCVNCKRMKPVIEEHCKEKNIAFQYEMIGNLPNHELDLIISKNIKQAPVFLIYKDGDEESPVVVSGDDVFLELGS